MRDPLLLCAATLVACTPAARDATANANASAAATPAPATNATNAAARSTGSVAVTKPGTLKTFRDWTVGCDNGLRCTMASLGADGGAFPAATIALARDAGPDGAIVVTLGDHGTDGRGGANPAGLAIDGRRFATGARIAGDTARAIAAALANARTLGVVDAGGTTIATLSPAGASAALRYIDAMQGRAGGTSATVARGPATVVPPAPVIPTLAAVSPSGTPTRPTAAQLAAMRTRAQCETLPPGASAGVLTPQVHALGGGRTLVLVPCSVGAYNVSSAMFLLDSRGVVPARTDAPSGFAETGASVGEPVPSVVEGEFAGGILTSYARGRGLGDCGVRQGFVWDGTRLRLSAQSEMGECRGNPDYVTTWRTIVIRR